MFLNSGVRHNVWIVLDSSGSMGNSFGGGQTRIEAARDVLTEVIDEFIDASGRPLVNWGFVRFGKKNVSPDDDPTACNAQFTNSAVRGAQHVGPHRRTRVRSARQLELD